MIEPPGHGIGRSRGGLSTKIHTAVDGKGRPLSILITGGQRNDGAVFTDVLDQIWVPSLSGTPDRTRPDTVIGDKGYTTPANRAYLRRRGIKTVIPERSDQIKARKRKGSRGGRPPGFDPHAYKGRHVVENHFGWIKQWRGIATRYDKLAITYRAGILIAAIIAWTQALGDTP